MAQLSHKARFDKYRDDAVISKCLQYAKWTLPQLMVDPLSGGIGITNVVERDYQEIGPMLVNNLAAKLTALLFPSSRPFFEGEYGEEVAKRAEARGVQTDELRDELSRLTLRACKRLFRNAAYAQLVQATRHLITTGNVLTHRDSGTQRITTYGLQSFAVQRDGSGVAMDVVLREGTYFSALSPEIQKTLRITHPDKYRRADETTAVELYTRIARKLSRRGRNYFVVSQEVDDIAVGTPGQYPEHLCPFQVITWNLIAGENYGRGLVEDYAGGFAKLSDLSEAAALYGIETMRVINLVAPGSGADIDEIATAESGQYVQGSPESVKSFESGSGQKLAVVRDEISDVFGNLARAFMWKANTRDAERVTAYELRLDAQEADNVLGGTYSSLAETWQVPMAHILMHEEKPALLEGILTDNIKLDIIAGVPALGRSIELQNLMNAAQDAAAIVPAFAQLSKRVDQERLFKLIMSLSNVDIKEFEKSKEQMRADAQAALAAQQGASQMMTAESGVNTATGLQNLA